MLLLSLYLVSRASKNSTYLAKFWKKQAGKKHFKNLFFSFYLKFSSDNTHYDYFFRAAFTSRLNILLSLAQFVLLLTNLIFFANNMRLLIEMYKNSEPSSDNLFLVLIFFLHLGNLIGWIWAQYFINGIKSMILSGSFATWYWTTDKTQVPKNTVQSFTTIIRK